VILIGTVLMPVSGFLMSPLGGTRVRAGCSSLFGDPLVAAVTLYVAGTAKYHRTYKGGVLRRMLVTRI